MTSVERVYDSQVMLVGHWWNGLHGTVTRRDIRLTTQEDAWVLEARSGGHVLGRWLYPDESRATAGVHHLITTDEMRAEWRDITVAFRASEAAARRRRGEVGPEASDCGSAP